MRTGNQGHQDSLSFQEVNHRTPRSHLHFGHNIHRTLPNMILLHLLHLLTMQNGKHIPFFIPFSSATSVTSCEVTLHANAQMRRDRFWRKRHGPKNPFEHITENNLAFPFHLSWSVWKTYRNICGGGWRGLCYLKELCRALSNKSTLEVPPYEKKSACAW